MDTKQAVVRHVKGLTFVGKATSNHWVAIDSSTNSEESPAAASPIELVLLALGSCTASDVVYVLQKKRLRFHGLEVHLTGERRDEHPRVYTKIHLEFVFHGDGLPQKDLEQAIELSQTKYCPVSAMIGKGTEITYTYKVTS
ncbi:MAG: OsmC family protein [Bacteroidota bacterium]|jgi:putative redox protein